MTQTSSSLNQRTMKLLFAVFVFCNLLMIMDTVAYEETMPVDMCTFLKWSGPCLKSKCSDACIRSGYVDGVCQNDATENADACYCFKHC
ncbi:putative knottin, scorpion toxin-like superfamily [Helianthus annuus]|uniref:Knottin, scorpion toxin-like superfamily n=2 Tax=Helianthus annuus TaxID=4232 RepID=A0A9K3INT6_HELAN|nr:putative knottin, scorpion toxin-like superfamily [Helianthus annuus]KAJ0905958.1 putative knottin, scorpion toxin-like superfamily [Helianthus annuus]